MMPVLEPAADATHDDLKSLRDNVCMELLWIEEAIASRKQVRM